MQNEEGYLFFKISHLDMQKGLFRQGLFTIRSKYDMYIL